MRTQSEAPASGTLARLAFVVIASCVPAALLAMALIGWDYYDRELDRLVRDSMGTARALAAAVDRELTGVKAGLIALATSPHLTSNDLGPFHDQAQAALKDQIFANVVLIAQPDRQVVNTLRRFGEPLPAAGNPPELQRIFDTGQAVITDLFVGPVVKKPYIAVGVPVRRDTRIVYSLNAGIEPERVSRLLGAQQLPPGWIGAILDRQGTIVARTLDPERFLGQKGAPALVQRLQEVPEDALETRTLEGIPVLTVFSRSPLTGWTVAIGIPMRELNAHLWYSMARLFLAGFIALLTALVLAYFFSRRALRR